MSATVAAALQVPAAMSAEPGQFQRLTTEEREAFEDDDDKYLRGLRDTIKLRVSECIADRPESLTASSASSSPNRTASKAEPQVQRPSGQPPVTSRSSMRSSLRAQIGVETGVHKTTSSPVESPGRSSESSVESRSSRKRQKLRKSMTLDGRASIRRGTERDTDAESNSGSNRKSDFFAAELLFTNDEMVGGRTLREYVQNWTPDHQARTLKRFEELTSEDQDYLEMIDVAKLLETRRSMMAQQEESKPRRSQTPTVRERKTNAEMLHAFRKSQCENQEDALLRARLRAEQAIRERRPSRSSDYVPHLDLTDWQEGVAAEQARQDYREATARHREAKTILSCRDGGKTDPAAMCTRWVHLIDVRLDCPPPAPYDRKLRSCWAKMQLETRAMVLKLVGKLLPNIEIVGVNCHFVDVTDARRPSQVLLEFASASQTSAAFEILRAHGNVGQASKPNVSQPKAGISWTDCTFAWDPSPFCSVRPKKDLSGTANVTEEAAIVLEQSWEKRSRPRGKCPPSCRIGPRAHVINSLINIGERMPKPSKKKTSHFTFSAAPKSFLGP